MGAHLVQLLLFVARYFLFVNIWVGRFAAWLVREKTVTVDDSHRIFNIDCRVSVSPHSVCPRPHHRFVGFCSIHKTPQNGRFRMIVRKLACSSFGGGWRKKSPIRMVSGLISPLKFDFRTRTTYG
jgi:hypothetical protein